MQVSNNSYIATLVHFNFWADNHILATSKRISVDEFTRLYVPDPGWASLRGILVHTLDTEYGWRSVLQELDADEILGVDDFPTVAVLKSQWDIERAAWINYVTGLRIERLNLGNGNDAQNGPKVWQTIVHVVTHGIQHRSEAAAILTGYGQSPGDLDFDKFLKEKSEL